MSLRLSSALAAELIPGSRVVGDPDKDFLRVHSDSRSLRSGDLFVALVGERFDGHDFLAAARAAGAAGAIAQRGLVEAGLSGLLVDDSLLALQALAAGWRARFDLPLIAVTGSNGKTTVTQMIAAILRAWQGDAALATAGNFNNHIGLPLTLLRLRDDEVLRHRCAAVELGMNHPGEIAVLARIAAPTVALVNNAQREHQEFMDSVEAVARENAAVFAALPASGVAVFPADDPHAPIWQRAAGSRPCLGFGLRTPADGRAGDQPGSAPSAAASARAAADVVGEAFRISDDAWALHLHTPAGRADLKLALAGEHNLRNAAAAAACALAAGAPLAAIVAGLEAFRPVAGRSAISSVHHRGRAAVLIDDSYNANPDSVRAAIAMLANQPAPRWLILGDMGEVGERGPEFHDEVGACARDSGIDHLWTAGAACRLAAAAFGPRARAFDGADELNAALDQAPEAGAILVKGSRFMRMERVVAALRRASDHPRPRSPNDAA